MDSFELNKILGAVLATCLGLLTLNIAAVAIFTPGKLEKPGYAIAVPDQVGQVRVTARELLDGDVAVRADLGLEVRTQLAGIELLAGAHRPGLIFDQCAHLYLARIRFATTILWTSSGPS